MKTIHRRTDTAIIAQLKVEGVGFIDEGADLRYSEDEQMYYLLYFKRKRPNELMIDDNCISDGTSKESFATPEEAIDFYRYQKVIGL